MEHNCEAILILSAMKQHQYYVYMMTNKINSVIYTGVTRDLRRRVLEHRAKIFDGFTKKYNVTKLVYYEFTNDIMTAIMREKQIKAGSRKRKIALIESMNREWKDLGDNICD